VAALTPDEWSAIGSVVQAVATVAAFAAAGYAVWLEKRGERRRDAEAIAERERARRRQASLVGAWLGPTVVTTVNGWRHDTLLVKNSSDLPVYELTCRLIVPSSHSSGNPVVALPPGDTLTMDVPNTSPGEAGIDRREARCLWVSFVDASGTMWYRSAAGELVEQVGNASPVRDPAP
jgi:hypothetical protein